MITVNQHRTDFKLHNKRKIGIFDRNRLVISKLKIVDLLDTELDIKSNWNNNKLTGRKKFE